MKRAIIYIASDGREFYDKEECKKYEADGCVEFSPLPEYGDHVPLTPENLHWMLNGDGSCYYATATKRSHVVAGGLSHPKWATHLIYFGK